MKLTGSKETGGYADHGIPLPSHQPSIIPWKNSMRFCLGIPLKSARGAKNYYKNSAYSAPLR
jgi:hypothetical protein